LKEIVPMATAQELLKRFQALKTLPHVAIRLSRVISEDTCTVKDLEEIIRLDPTLVLRLLRLVNSPYYALSEKANSIARAVIFIGMKNLRNLVVIEALKDIFKKGDREGVFSRHHLWLHCAAVSICSQMISERIFGQMGEDAFLCGILHDIGMIVAAQVAPDMFFQACGTYSPESAPFTQLENDIVGTDHSKVGYFLAADWKLPLAVREAIRDHHKISATVTPESVTGTVQLAEYMVSRINYAALPGMTATLSPPLITHIHDNLEEYKTLARDLPDEMVKAKDLYAVPAE
jgi:putative nucleotidyltransferase with HDIG domain